MALLIESSIYIGWLRRRLEFHRLLRDRIGSGEIYICGVVRAEVLRGVTNPAQKSRIEDFFDLLPEVPTDARMWREATDLAWQLDRTGQVLPLTDVVIAACTLRIDAVLVTADQHFARIPGLRTRAELPAE